MAGLNSLTPATSHPRKGREQRSDQGRPLSTHSDSTGAEQPSSLTALCVSQAERCFWRNWQTATACFLELERRLALALSCSYHKAQSSLQNDTWSKCCPWPSVSLPGPPLLHLQICPFYCFFLGSTRHSIPPSPLLPLMLGSRDASFPLPWAAPAHLATAEGLLENGDVQISVGWKTAT